jgi:hypothetical protein
MEKLVKLKGLTKDDLKQVKPMRLWIRVVTVADMVNEAGTNIMDNMMYREQIERTDLKRPRSISQGKTTGQHSED